MIKTAELQGAALDWAVAKCESVEVSGDKHGLMFNALLTLGHISMGQSSHRAYKPSTDWAVGGPIIEREIAKIERFSDALWEATAFTNNAQDFVQTGPTPLIAAMRCFVFSKLGNEVEIPEGLA